MSKDDDLVRGPAPLLYDDLVFKESTAIRPGRPGNITFRAGRAGKWVGADLGDMPPLPDGDIIFATPDGSPALTITPDGKFIAGDSVVEDADVYREFKAWLQSARHVQGGGFAPNDGFDINIGTGESRS